MKTRGPFLFGDGKLQSGQRYEEFGLRAFDVVQDASKLGHASRIALAVTDLF